MPSPTPAPSYAASARALAPLGDPPAWLTALTRPERVTAALHAFPPAALGRDVLEEAVTERLRVKKGQWQVRLRARVRAPDGTPRAVLLVGTLQPPVTDEDAVPRLEVSVAEPDAPDPDLPVVARLLDPAAAASLLEPLLQAAVPGAHVGSVEPAVLRSKPGSRCTVGYRVRYRSEIPGQPERVVAKAYADDTGARTHEAMAALEVAGRRPAFLAEPLGYLPDERLLLQRWVDGDRSVKDLAHAAFASEDPGLLAQLRSALAHCGVALAALHASGATYGGVTRFGDELAEAADDVAEAAAAVPGLRAWTGPLLRALSARATAVPEGPLVSAHGGFRPAQVLVGTAGVWLVDLDGAGAAEAAMDLGRFCAGLGSLGVTDLDVPDVSPETVRQRLRLLDGCCAVFLDAYAALAPVDPRRVHLWQALDLLDSLLHAWTHGRPDRAASRCALLVHHLGAEPATAPSDGEVRQRPVEVG